MHATTKNSYGFTLVEMSVVLVIIGMIVGSIMAGRSIIHSGEMVRQISQLQTYKTAMQTFQAKYDCLPGDCANATSHLGAKNSDPVTCVAAGAASTQTCNGDGNGIIGNNAPELYHFWVQLNGTTLIPEGPFTGVADASGGTCAGENAPASKISNGAVGIVYSAGIGHRLQLGNTSVCTGAPVNALLTAADALEIDTKMDDGSPGNGDVQSVLLVAPTPTCVTTNNPGTSKYDSTQTSAVCALLFKTGF